MTPERIRVAVLKDDVKDISYFTAYLSLDDLKCRHLQLSVYVPDEIFL